MKKDLNKIFLKDDVDQLEKLLLDEKNKDIDIDIFLKKPLFTNSKYKTKIVHSCCFYGSINCLKFLYGLDFPLDIADSNGFYPFQMALLNGQMIVLDFFDDIALNYDKFKAQNFESIHLAVYSNSIPIISKFLLKGHNINLLDSQLRTPIYFSLFNETEELINFLIENGSDINIPIFNNEYILEICCKNKLFKIINLLIEKNCNPFQKTLEGLPLFFYLITLNQNEIIDYFLNSKKKININFQDEDGWTALHFAVQYKNLNLCLKFISYGANINIKTNSGFTVTRLSYGFSKKIYQFFINKGGQI